MFNALGLRCRTETPSAEGKVAMAAQVLRQDTARTRRGKPRKPMPALLSEQIVESITNKTCDEQTARCALWSNCERYSCMDAGEGVGIQGAPQMQTQFVPLFLYGVKRPQREAIHSPTRNARLYNT